MQQFNNMSSGRKDQKLPGWQNEPRRSAAFVPLPPRLPLEERVQSSKDTAGPSQTFRSDQRKSIRPEIHNSWPGEESDSEVHYGDERKRSKYLDAESKYLEKYAQMRRRRNTDFPSAGLRTLRRDNQDVLHPYLNDFQDELLWHFRDAGFVSGTSQIRLRLPNMIADFVAVELDPEDSIWDLVILTGNCECISAMTCGEYVSKRWPSVAGTLEILFNMIGKPGGSSTSSLGQLVMAMWLMQDSDTGWETLNLNLESGTSVLTEVCQAIAWLFAAIQGTEGLSDDEDLPAFALASMRRIEATSGLAFDLDLRAFELLATMDASKSCWLPLFPRYAIAADHWRTEPIHGDVWLRMGFDLMCLLSGLEYEESLEDGFVLYGANSLVYPVQYDKEEVYWHFQDRERSEEPLTSFLKGSSLSNLLQGDQVHLLGLWPDPLVTLGTDRDDIARVRNSLAPEVRQSYERDGVAWSGTMNAPKVLGVGALINYKIAHNRKNLYMSNFRRDMRRMVGRSTLLYSPSEKRAWIVSTLSVILHVARVQVKRDPGAGYEIPAACLSDNGGQAAFRAIMDACRPPPESNTANNVYDEADTKNPVKCAIREVAAAFDCARRKTYRARRLFRNCILGYELADLIDEDMLYLKRQPMDFASGWTPLLDEVDLTLFYEDVFDPIICGGGAAALCPREIWRKIPSEFNILTASLPCLLKICQRFSDPRHIDHLTQDHRWHNPNDTRDVFFTCQRTDEHVCNRLQEVIGNNWLRGTSISRPSCSNIMAHRNGAVIFRYDLDMTAIEFALSASPNLRQYRGIRRPAADSNLVTGRYNDSDSGYSSPNVSATRQAAAHERACTETAIPPAERHDALLAVQSQQEEWDAPRLRRGGSRDLVEDNQRPGNERGARQLQREERPRARERRHEEREAQANERRNTISQQRLPTQAQGQVANHRARVHNKNRSKSGSRSCIIL